MSKPTYVPQARPVTMSNDGSSEAEFIGWHALDCPACGGSGHKDDVPATVSIIRNGEQARPDGGEAVAWVEARAAIHDAYQSGVAGTGYSKVVFDLHDKITHPAPAPDVALPQWAIALRDEAERSAMKTGFNLTRDEVLTLTGSKFAPLTAAQQEADHG